MPQPGLHAALALAASRAFSTERSFALGLAFGSILPDADAYPQAFAVLVLGMDRHSAEALCHRTLTHTLFVPLAVALVTWLAPAIRRDERLRAFGLGLAAGMALVHSVVDIFWFYGVGILWPLWSVNLWSWLNVSERAIALFRASNFLSFALYFSCLAWLAGRMGTSRRYLACVRLHAYIQLGIGVAFSVLAVILPPATYNAIDGAAYLFLAYPSGLWVTWQMRETIEAVGYASA